MATVYRREPSRSGSGFVVDYTRTAFKQSEENFNAKRSKELQTVYERSHYSSAGQSGDMVEFTIVTLSTVTVSMATAGLALYFGGPGKAAIAYFSTLFLGYSGFMAYKN